MGFLNVFLKRCSYCSFDCMKRGGVDIDRIWYECMNVITVSLVVNLDENGENNGFHNSWYDCCTSSRFLSRKKT